MQNSTDNNQLLYNKSDIYHIGEITPRHMTWGLIIMAYFLLLAYIPIMFKEINICICDAQLVAASLKGKGNMSLVMMSLIFWINGNYLLIIQRNK